MQQTDDAWRLLNQETRAAPSHILYHTTIKTKQHHETMSSNRYRQKFPKQLSTFSSWFYLTFLNCFTWASFIGPYSQDRCYFCSGVFLLWSNIYAARHFNRTAKRKFSGMIVENKYNKSLLRLFAILRTHTQ